MIILTLLSLLTGMVLGLRFNVLILVPAIGCALFIALIVAVARAEVLWPAAMAAAGIASLQIGYLAGGGIRHFAAAARMSGLRNGSFANSQPARRVAH